MLRTIGGRPGLRRLLVSYFLAASLRCQATSVASVTGKISVQRLREEARPTRRTTPGQPARTAHARRDGAAPRSRAGAPAAPRSWTLTSGRAGPASRRAGRRPGRAGGGTRLTIMPYDHTSPQVTGPGHILAPDSFPAGSGRHDHPKRFYRSPAMNTPAAIARICNPRPRASACRTPSPPPPTAVRPQRERLYAPLVLPGRCTPYVRAHCHASTHSDAP